MTTGEKHVSQWIFGVGLAATFAAGGCNNVGSCPSAEAITPGGSCSGESLECAYTLQTASPACDGLIVEGGLATSCVCTKSTWTCPAPVSCPDAGADDGGSQDAAGDGGATSSDGNGGDGIFEHGD
jgi:hypothetical protein